MYENSAAKVMEMTQQWERGARITKPTEVEQAAMAWRAQRAMRRTPPYRAAIAKMLLALATRIAPTVAVPNPSTPALAP